MKHSNSLIFNFALNLLCGLTISFLSTLLIYFKQKEVFHHIAVLLCIFVIYFASNKIRNWLPNFSVLLKIVTLAVILLISWLGPQFLYQVWPHTFYISGIVIGSVVVMAISTSVLNEPLTSQTIRNYILFLIGYTAGYFLTPDILQYCIFGFSLCSVLFFLVSGRVKTAGRIAIGFATLILVVGFRISYKPVVLYEDQLEYEDKVLFSTYTQYHKLVISQWKKDYWFFIDKLKNLCSIDEFLYYEPMTHSLFRVADQIEEVLVIGGENGCLIREVLKYQLTKVSVVSYDTILRKLGEENEYFVKVNQHAYSNSKVRVIKEDLLDYISSTSETFDAVFIDLPDPRSIETNQFYTFEFYKLLNRLLKKDGLMVTQAGSPYFATAAYHSIGKTIRSAGFNILPIHNQILTLGEWGWYICSPDRSSEVLLRNLLAEGEPDIETKWFNQEAAYLISAFGKTYADTLHVGINTLENPLLYQYYLQGTWDLN